MNAKQRTYHPLRDSAAWEIILNAEGELTATRNGDLVASGSAVFRREAPAPVAA